MKFSATLFAVGITTTTGFTLRYSPSSISVSRLDTALNKYKVFIDGEAGTTGIQVRGRIASRDDLEIISAPDELRKDEATRKKLINEADVVILCKLLPTMYTCRILNSTE
jgi:N-acetyl-gamma-glutamyl-phosphate reductase